MRWTPYDGSRIRKIGFRTFVEDPPSGRFQDAPRRYGYTWAEGDSYFGYYEVPRPGYIEDVELGRFSTRAAARRAVEASLTEGETSTPTV